MTIELLGKTTVEGQIAWTPGIVPLSFRKQMIIYISAPYSKGDTAENVRNACLAANMVEDKGYRAFPPHIAHIWHLITPKTYQEWLEWGLAFIPRMDAVLRLPGESRGADDEVALAQKLGIRVYYSIDEIEDIT